MAAEPRVRDPAPAVAVDVVRLDRSNDIVAAGVPLRRSASIDIVVDEAVDVRVRELREPVRAARAPILAGVDPCSRKGGHATVLHCPALVDDPNDERSGDGRPLSSRAARSAAREVRLEATEQAWLALRLISLALRAEAGIAVARPAASFASPFNSVVSPRTRSSIPDMRRFCPLAAVSILQPSSSTIPRARARAPGRRARATAPEPPSPPGRRRCAADRGGTSASA